MKQITDSTEQRKLLHAPCSTLNDQQGVTLLFSLFVMAGVATITASVGFFALQELRTSRAVGQSEPSIVAAESGVESGLWQINRRQVMPNNCTNPEDASTQPSSNTQYLRCMSWGRANIELSAGIPLVFFLYDPDDLNGNLNPGYTYLLATHLSGQNSITIAIERLDATPISTTILTPGSPPRSIALPTNPSQDNRFRVALTSSGNVTVELNTNLGMPDFPTLNAEGWVASSQFKRKLEILVPQ